MRYSPRSLQERLLELVFDLGLRHGRAVLAVAAALTVAGAVVASGITISTSQSALVSQKHPVQAEYARFVREFGAIENLIVVLQGDPAALKPASEIFASALREQDSWVGTVFYKVDIDLFTRRALLFVPPEVLVRGLEVLEKQRSVIERGSRITSLPSMLEVMESGFGSPDLAFHPDTAVNLLKAIEALFAEWRLWVSDPARKEIDLMQRLFAAGHEVNPVVRSGGYLVSNDGRMLFIFVQPRSASDESAHLRPFIAAMRGTVDRVFEQHPELRSRVKVGFTGLPAHVLTEVDTVFTDVGNGIVVAVVLVTLVVFVGFRSLRKVTVSVIPLITGMVLSVALVRLTVGRLNLISAGFFAVMYGMCIDFGIYLIRRTEEELGRGVDRPEAVRTALVKAGVGVLAGGLTAAAAFFAVALSGFAGFGEFGIAAGISTLVCLSSVFLLAPCLALRLKLEPRRADVSRVTSLAASRPARWLMGAFAVSAIASAIAGVWVLPRARFDYNALHLLPRDTESTELQVRMQEESDFQVSATVATADTLEEMRSLVARLRALPEVRRVESLADLVPDQQAEKLQLIGRYRPLLGDVKLEFKSPGDGLESYVRPLGALTARLGEAEEAAFNGGRSDLVERIEALQTELGGLRQALVSAGEAQGLERTRAFERNLFDNALRFVGLAREWFDAKPVTEGQLAPEILARFKGRNGKYMAYVFPKGSIWDVAFLDRYIAHLKEVTPHVTGFPATHQVFAHLVVRGFVESMLYAFAAIVIILALSLGRVRAVVLSLLPLVAAMLLLQALLHLARVEHNYASIAAFPVLLGYGVAYGVNIVQRWRENPGVTAFVSAYTVGKGVLLSAAAMLSGLGSIVFARHRGVAVFGQFLFVGIVLCLILAVFMLPAVIDLVYGRRNGASNGTN